MGLAHSPSIVTDGLVLCLDAANPKSYPGSGTLAYDLSPTKAIGNLLNGVAIVSSGGGSFSFDKIDDSISNVTPSINLTTGQITLSCWVYHTVLTTGYPAGVQRYISLPSEVAVIRNDGSSGNRNQLHFYITTSGVLRHLRVNVLTGNIWQHVAGTWDGTTQRVYLNAVEQSSATPGGTLGTPTNDWTITSSGECMSGYISLPMVYNRALTGQEILQNYNAHRARFGI